MATAAAPPIARKHGVWWTVSFAAYMQELRQTAHGKGPERAPLKPKLFNGRYLNLNVARQAITALSASKVLADVALEFEVPTAEALPQCFDQDTAQKLVDACIDVAAAQEATSQERDGTPDFPFEMCVHCVGREAELPKLIAAIKAEKRVLRCEGDKAKLKAKGEKSEKSEGSTSCSTKMGAGVMFSNLGAFQAIIAKGAPRRASDADGHRKGQTLIISECKEDEVQKMAFEMMMGKCIPLAHPGVTCDNIRRQVHHCTGNAKGHEQKEGKFKYSRLFAMELAETYEELWLPVRDGLEQHQKRGTVDENVARWRERLQLEQAGSSGNGRSTSQRQELQQEQQHESSEEDPAAEEEDAAAAAAVAKRLRASEVEKKMAASKRKKAEDPASSSAAVGYKPPGLQRTGSRAPRAR